MSKNKVAGSLFVLILIIYLMGCAMTQPILDNCNNSVLRVNDENVIGKFETIKNEVTDKEVEEELLYRLIQYSKLENIKANAVESGDVVYIVVTLYDSNYNELLDYNNMELDFIVGDYYFDKNIENKLLGHTVGDEFKVTSINNTVFSSIQEAKYYSMKIVNAERYIYPMLTETFLTENFDVLTKKELYDKIRSEIEWIQYELALTSVEDELVEKIICDSDFDEKFDSLVEQRYQMIVEKYENYGRLYGMTVEEVLEEFEMDLEDVRENAKIFQGEWELVLYYVEQGELQFERHEIDSKMKKYALENGYNSIEELVEDSGEKYLIEQVCVKEMKDYLYEKYVGEIERNEN